MAIRESVVYPWYLILPLDKIFPTIPPNGRSQCLTFSSGLFRIWNVRRLNRLARKFSGSIGKPFPGLATSQRSIPLNWAPIGMEYIGLTWFDVVHGILSFFLRSRCRWEFLTTFFRVCCQPLYDCHAMLYGIFKTCRKSVKCTFHGSTYPPPGTARSHRLWAWTCGLLIPPPPGAFAVPRSVNAIVAPF